MEKTEEILKKYINDHNYTQDNLAILTGMSRSFLSHVLIGNKRASKKTISTLCQVLGVSIEDKEKIEFYEEFMRTPGKFQDRFYSMSIKLEQQDKEIARLRSLEELDKMLDIYYEKRKFLK